jgi:hypothetical protein
MRAFASAGLSLSSLGAEGSPLVRRIQRTGRRKQLRLLFLRAMCRQSGVLADSATETPSRLMATASNGAIRASGKAGINPTQAPDYKQEGSESVTDVQSVAFCTRGRLAS